MCMEICENLQNWEVIFDDSPVVYFEKSNWIYFVIEAKASF